jgi:hypothetical protein
MAPRLLTDLPVEIVSSIVDFALYPADLVIVVRSFGRGPHNVFSSLPPFLHACKMLRDVGMELLAAELTLKVYPPFFLEQLPNIIPATMLGLVHYLELEDPGKEERRAEGSVMPPTLRSMLPNLSAVCINCEGYSCNQGDAYDINELRPYTMNKQIMLDYLDEARIRLDDDVVKDLDTSLTLYVMIGYSSSFIWHKQRGDDAEADYIEVSCMHTSSASR